MIFKEEKNHYVFIKEPKNTKIRYERYNYFNNKWVALRKVFLVDNHYCVLCKKTWDLEVDHIIEINEDESLIYDFKNLNTLCINCHSAKSNFFKNLIVESKNLVLEINYDTTDNFNDYLSFYENNFWVALNFYKLNNVFKIRNVIKINLYKVDLLLLRLMLFRLIDEIPVEVKVSKKLFENGLELYYVKKLIFLLFYKNHLTLI